MKKQEFLKVVFNAADEFGWKGSKVGLAKWISKLYSYRRNGDVFANNKYKPISIYCLVNPIDGTVFYVGRTCMPLKRRLMFHNSVSIKCNKAKEAVIRDIKSNGMSPIIKELEVFKPKFDYEYNGRHEREDYWINEFSRIGHNLTNGHLKYKKIAV